MAGNNMAPDLQSILQTLSQFAPPSDTNINNMNFNINHPQERPSQSPTPEIDQEALQKAQEAPPLADTTNALRPKPQSNSTAAASKPIIDPASITIWPEALRCVTKIAAQNEHFGASIKRMMKEQRDNEIRWYTQRQNLKRTQANRSSSKAQADAILKTLNTSFYGAPPPVQQQEVSDEDELADFDSNIWALAAEMEKDMDAKLKALGVPFFGTDPSLIVEDGARLPKTRLADSPKYSPLVTVSQLRELRRQMIKHLETLYRED